MRSREEAARLLDNISESLSVDVDPDRLARVAGQFITPDGHQVYQFQMNGRTAFVTIPED
jgi:hypothetical protein